MNNQINIKVTSTIVSVYYRERAVNSLAYRRANWEQRQVIVVKYMTVSLCVYLGPGHINSRITPRTARLELKHEQFRRCH